MATTTTTGGDTAAEEPAATTAAADEPDATVAPATTAGAEEEPEATEPPGTTAAAGEIAFDIGVDETTIKVGMLADLSGAFAPLVTEIVEAQKVYWDNVNDERRHRRAPGRAHHRGQRVRRAPCSRRSTRRSADEVAILSQSTGSPHTAAISGNLVEDDLIAIPLSWYSGWAFRRLGKNVFETYTSYCVESMNGLEWLNENRDVQTVAIISFPGEYGGDGSAGAKLAAEALGLEVVFDGSGQVTPPSADNPNPDQTAIISQIVSTNPDAVWATINPTTLGVIMGGAVVAGLPGPVVRELADLQLQAARLRPRPAARPVLHRLDVHRHAGAPTMPGMAEVVDAMTAAAPDLPVSDVYILGWTEAMVTQKILEQAAANGDMTRAGIVAAANQVEVDFNGLAPNQTWAGDPNEFLVRESYIYDVSLDAYNPVTLGEEGGSTGWELLEGPYVSDTAAAFDNAGAVLRVGLT